MKKPFSVNSFVDKVYVLSVKSFKDRIQHIKEEMGRHNIQFEFIFDYDIPELTPAILKKNFSHSSCVSYFERDVDWKFNWDFIVLNSNAIWFIYLGSQYLLFG